MAFNLTETQKDVLRWMVEEVQAGRLGEEFTLLWFLGSEGPEILEYQGDAQGKLPVLTPGVLAALETAEMIVQDIRYRTKTQTRGTRETLG